MRSRTANWFECKVRYEKVMDDGLQKKVNEQYIVNGVSFGDAEKRITEEMSQYVSGGFDILNINPCPFGEIFFSDASEDDRWYRARLVFITVDEKTEKEKRSKVQYLVQAGSFDVAKKHIEEVMGGTMIDYVIEKVEETAYMDVFEYAGQDKQGMA